MIPRLPALVVAALVAAVPSCFAADVVPSSREQIHLTFAPLVRQAAPAVVNIYTKRVVHTTVSPFFNDPFFRQFFGEGMGIPRERIERSLGSGVVVRSDGVVVTNYHVIKDAQEITVVLADRREFEAKILGTDERTDLAVLKIEAGGEALPVLPLGDSDALQVGDIVLAIGDPFGVGQTVTMGIVSALARTSVGVSDYRFFIQTDAAINPGNSGGALIDLDGRVVGINSAIYSQSGGSVGIGFAIPANMVKAVLASITSGGKAVRPWLGVGGQAVTAEMFQSLHLSRPMGVLVNTVQPGSPAEAAGIRVGDVVTAIDGRAVDDPEALRFRIATMPVDSRVTIAVTRAGREMTVEARLSAPPDIPPRDTSEIGGRNPFAGATVANVNPALAEDIGLETVAKGVVVLRVRSGSIAQRVGFQQGDVLLKVNGRVVASVAELKAMAAEGGDSWQIAIERGGEVMTVSIGG